MASEPLGDLPCAARLTRARPAEAPVAERRPANADPELSDGLRWATEQSLQVLTPSLGTTDGDWPASLHERADAAYRRGIAPAIGTDTATRGSSPWLSSSAISRACSEERGPFRFYYNHKLSAACEKIGINTTVASRDGGSAKITGNSIAASQMSGIVALTLAKHPDLTPFVVKTLLRSTAWNATYPPPSPPVPGASGGDG